MYMKWEFVSWCFAANQGNLHWKKKGFVLVTSVQLLWTVARLVFVFFYLYMSTNSFLNSETGSYIVLMNLAWALCTEMFEFIPFL